MVMRIMRQVKLNKARSEFMLMIFILSSEHSHNLGVTIILFPLGKLTLKAVWKMKCVTVRVVVERPVRRQL